MPPQPIKYPALRDWFDQKLYAYGGRRYGPSALARDLGVAASVATNWINGVRAPEEIWIYLLAFHLHCDPTAIFTALGQPPRYLAFHRYQVALCRASEAEREQLLVGLAKPPAGK